MIAILIILLLLAAAVEEGCSAAASCELDDLVSQGWMRSAWTKVDQIAGGEGSPVPPP